MEFRYPAHAIVPNEKFSRFHLRYIQNGTEEKEVNMSNKNKISTILGIVGLVFGLYSYFLVEKNSVILITSVVCLSIVLNNLFNKK